MKCMSCEMEIDPKWKHAIESNMCPFCGQLILSEQLKTLFVDLRITMEGLQEFKEQLDDWMYSNHNYIKADSPKLKEMLKGPENKEKHTVKVRTEHGEEDVVVERIQSEEQTTEFFKRAEAFKPKGDKSPAEKTSRLKAIVKQIKSGGGASLTSFDVEDDGGNMNDISELESAITGEPAINSALTNPDDDEIPAQVLAMAQTSGGSDKNNKDIRAHQEMYAKQAESRKNFQNGSKGSFSRG
jgi:Zn-finger nucleic acid-binding protein